VTIGAAIAGLIGAGNLIAWLAGAKVAGKHPAAGGIILFSLMMLACAAGTAVVGPVAAGGAPQRGRRENAKTPAVDLHDRLRVTNLPGRMAVFIASVQRQHRHSRTDHEMRRSVRADGVSEPWGIKGIREAGNRERTRQHGGSQLAAV